ncbi:MAG: phosphoribosylformylglycinamidine synthase-associated small membrane protein [Hyphomicrobiaceae bacterium]
MSPKPKQVDDAARAIRFVAIKAGIFIGIPLLVAIVAIIVMLG